MRKLIILPALLSAMLALSACGQAGEPASAPEATGPAAAEPAVIMPEDAPPQEEAIAADSAPMETAAPDQSTAGGEPGSCLAEIGATRSARLVQRCIAVSPATHPPCNAVNPCALVQGEIDRSCAMYGPEETKPSECEA